MKFRVTDSSVNQYGFRILTSGIDWSLFDKNPIMLWMHSRAWGKNDPLPIGKWKDRQLDGDAVTLEPVFDETDEFAVRIKSKVDQEIINMTSIGLDIIEESVDPSVLLPGQTRPTITKSVAKEVSFVDIGGNYNAVRLFKDGVEIKLSEGMDNEILPLINQTNMKSIALKLGLPENATEDQILAKIGEVNTEMATLKSDKAELTATVKRINDEKCAALVDGAISQKKITADKRETFLKMAAGDFETCKSVLDTMSGSVKPSDLIAGSHSVPAETETWATLTAKGAEAVTKMKAEDPEKYRKLYRENYGIDPRE